MGDNNHPQNVPQKQHPNNSQLHNNYQTHSSASINSPSPYSSYDNFTNDTRQQQQYNNPQQGSPGLPNLDINSVLGLSNSNNPIPPHLGHHGGHHMVQHLMGGQYNFTQPPQPQPAYVGPTHSMMPNIPNNNNNQNIQYNTNNTNNINSMQMMNNNMQQMMNGGMQLINNGNNTNIQHVINNNQQEEDTYSQDVLLLVVEQQRRIYHLEEELQKAQEFIIKLQDYAKNLEIDREKNAKKQSRYWTQQEHKKFLQGIDKYGRKDVKAISTFVGSRNPTQVRTHAQKYYAKIDKDQRRAKKGKRNSNSSNSEMDSDNDILPDGVGDDDLGSSSSEQVSTLNDSGLPQGMEQNFVFPNQQNAIMTENGNEYYQRQDV